MNDIYSKKPWGFIQIDIDCRLKEIESALNNHLYQSAVSLALTIPDICGKAKYDIDNIRKRYVDWYDEYVGKFYFPSLVDTEIFVNGPEAINGEIIYGLRCAFLHSGDDKIEDRHLGQFKFMSGTEKAYPQYIFTLTGTYRTDISHNGNTGEEKRNVWIDIPMFCKNIIRGANKFFSVMTDEEKTRIEEQKFFLFSSEQFKKDQDDFYKE